MDKYTIASVGAYFVLLDPRQKSIMFTTSKHECDFIAGEATIAGERHVILNYGSNILKSFPFSMVSLSDFTDKIPDDITKIKGDNISWVKIGFRKYIKLAEGVDYFVYNTKAYSTKDYREIYQTDALITVTTDSDYLENFDLLPKSTKFINIFKFIENNTIGLQMLIVNKKIYFTMSEYIEDMPVSHHGIIISGDDPNYYKYFVSNNDKIVILRIGSDQEITTTDDITQAARPPEFGGIYKFPGQYVINEGINSFADITIKSTKNIGLVDMYSTVGTREIVFCITHDYKLKILDHKYSTPKATKMALRDE